MSAAALPLIDPVIAPLGAKTKESWTLPSAMFCVFENEIAPTESAASVPVSTPVIDQTFPPSVAPTIVFCPPAPPSTVATCPAGPTSKVSFVSAAPTRCSKPANGIPPTDPLAASRTFQVVSAAGPMSVSSPAPPSSVTPTLAEASDESMVNVSPPPPVVTLTLVIDAIPRDWATPSTVTTTVSAATATTTAWAVSPPTVTVHADGDGAPLAVFGVGSGVDVAAAVTGAVGAVGADAGATGSTTTAFCWAAAVAVEVAELDAVSEVVATVVVDVCVVGGCSSYGCSTCSVSVELGAAAGARSSLASRATGIAPSSGAGAMSSGAAGAATGAPSAGSETTVPISSSMTGAFANGSCAAGRVPPRDGAVCECVSLTTGTRRRTALPRRVFLAVVGTCFGAAVVRAAGSAGSGGSACTFGTRNSGTGRRGIASAGSATFGAGAAACRNTAAVGAAYMPTRTSKLTPTQTYLKPRARKATKPHGFVCATAAYASTVTRPLLPTPLPTPRRCGASNVPQIEQSVNSQQPVASTSRTG